MEPRGCDLEVSRKSHVPHATVEAERRRKCFVNTKNLRYEMTVIVWHGIKNVLTTDSHPEVVTEAESSLNINQQL
jgi:hypothetical protein